MAYGTPENSDEVEPYFTHIRGGRQPSPEAVENLKERYRLVGGKTPLLEITHEVARKLEERLNREGWELQGIRRYEALAPLHRRRDGADEGRWGA